MHVRICTITVRIIWSPYVCAAAFSGADARAAVISRNRDDSLACQRWDLHRRRDWPNPISNSMPTMLTEVDAEIEVVAECKQASRLAHN